MKTTTIARSNHRKASIRSVPGAGAVAPLLDNGYRLSRAENPSPAGLLCSHVFPGLWLDAAALLAGDLPKLVRQLQKGLRSAQHRQFVKRLAKN